MPLRIWLVIVTLMIAWTGGLAILLFGMLQAIETAISAL
jgi:hypothetical protein